MTNTIRIKRRASGAAGAPTSLENAELAYNEVDDTLYYGKGTGGAGGSATTIEAIAGNGAFVSITGTQTVTGNKTFSGTVNLSGTVQLAGTEVTATAVEINVLDGATAGTAVANKALVVNANKDLDLNGGDLTAQDVTVAGNLTVQGTTTTIDSVTVEVADKNIVLGNVESPNDTTADGGGITLKGTTDKTLNWIDATDAWTSSENLELAAGKALRIDGAQVLSKTALGSSVVSSSLTSVGTIGTGTWQGSTVGVAYGGTGQTSYTDGQLLIGNTATGGLTKSTLTAGSNITITNGNGAITIAATSGGGEYTAGNGLDLVGSEFSVDLKANGGLVIESTELALDLSASSITGTLAIADGGTGATTESGARTALGLGTMAVQNANNVAITGGTIDGITFDGGTF